MSDLIQHDRAALAAYRKADEAFSEARRALAALVFERAAAWRTLLQETGCPEEDWSGDLHRLSAYDRLKSWKLEGDNFRAYFEDDRGEYDIDINLPASLLAADWEAQLAKLREERVVRQREDAEAARLATEAAERSQLSELQKKYGA